MGAGACEYNFYKFSKNIGGWHLCDNIAGGGASACFYSRVSRVSSTSIQQGWFAGYL